MCAQKWCTLLTCLPARLERRRLRRLARLLDQPKGGAQSLHLGQLAQLGHRQLPVSDQVSLEDLDDFRGVFKRNEFFSLQRLAIISSSNQPVPNLRLFPGQSASQLFGDLKQFFAPQANKRRRTMRRAKSREHKLNCSICLLAVAPVGVWARPRQIDWNAPSEAKEKKKERVESREGKRQKSRAGTSLKKFAPRIRPTILISAKRAGGRAKSY